MLMRVGQGGAEVSRLQQGFFLGGGAAVRVLFVLGSKWQKLGGADGRPLGRGADFSPSAG